MLRVESSTVRSLTTGPSSTVATAALAATLTSVSQSEEAPAGVNEFVMMEMTEDEHREYDWQRKPWMQKCWIQLQNRFYYQSTISAHSSAQDEGSDLESITGLTPEEIQGVKQGEAQAEKNRDSLIRKHEGSVEVTSIAALKTFWTTPALDHSVLLKMLAPQIDQSKGPFNARRTNCLPIAIAVWQTFNEHAVYFVDQNTRGLTPSALGLDQTHRATAFSSVQKLADHVNQQPEINAVLNCVRNPTIFTRITGIDGHAFNLIKNGKWVYLMDAQKNTVDSLNTAHADFEEKFCKYFADYRFDAQNPGKGVTLWSKKKSGDESSAKLRD